ncbi:MAG TPA: sialidase family protein, partial [Chloroflexota bacterium]|nr:sialidase family protein [Chloroflexota bacterium]
TVQWLRMAAHQPSTLYVGGTRSCYGINGDGLGSDQYCPQVLLRSTDGGASWTDLSAVPSLGLGILDDGFFQAYNSGYLSLSEPLAVSGDGTHLYASVTTEGTTPTSSGSYVLGSANGGLAWKNVSPEGGPYGAGSMASLTISPITDSQLYANYYGDDGEYGVASSADGGATWHTAGKNAPGGTPTNGVLPGVNDLSSFAIVPDTARAQTIYVNLHGGAVPVLRSDNAGATWVRMNIPTASPPLKAFQVSMDPFTPGLLVGGSAGANSPADRRYRSTDQGATWQAGVCAGDLHGECPAFTVQNVFGDGAQYAFLPDGIHRFHGSGSAESRLSISTALPFQGANVLAVAAGTTAHSPVYVLSKDPAGTVPVRLYRSTDQGRNWQDLSPAMLPDVALHSTAPGTRYIKQTGHSVAAPFVEMYNKLGPYLLGYPLTEAYMRGTTLTQDFEHLRLEQHGSSITIGNLGFEVMAAQHQNLGYAVTLSGGGYGGDQPQTTRTQMFFKDTGHLLTGEFLHFWQTQQGSTLLGPPISEAYRDQNGDGSGRKYLMQWFEHGRLELHPENGHSRFRFLLGLVGRDWWGQARPSR